MTDFEQWIQTTPEYKNLLIQHGERLFIMRDGEYEILTVRLAHRAWVQCGGLNVTVEDDGVLNPKQDQCEHKWVRGHWGGDQKAMIEGFDLYVPIQSR